MLKYRMMYSSRHFPSYFPKNLQSPPVVHGEPRGLVRLFGHFPLKSADTHGLASSLTGTPQHTKSYMVLTFAFNLQMVVKEKIKQKEERQNQVVVML